MKRRGEDQGSVTVGTMSSAAMWAALLTRQPDGRPEGEGWKTVLEIAEDMGRDRETARSHVDKWRRQGVVEIAWGTTGPTRQRTMFVRPKAAAGK